MSDAMEQVALIKRVSDERLREAGFDPSRLYEQQGEGPYAVIGFSESCPCCGSPSNKGWTVVNLETAIGHSKEWRGLIGETEAHEVATMLNYAWKQGRQGLSASPDAKTLDAVVERAQISLLHEVACDLHYLMGRASAEGYDAGQELATQIQRKMEASLAMRAELATRSAILEEAARVAEYAHMVPPDGGSPTVAEQQVAEEAGRRIRALIVGHPQAAP